MPVIMKTTGGKGPDGPEPKQKPKAESTPKAASTSSTENFLKSRPALIGGIALAVVLVVGVLWFAFGRGGNSDTSSLDTPVANSTPYTIPKSGSNLGAENDPAASSGQVNAPAPGQEGNTGTADTPPSAYSAASGGPKGAAAGEQNSPATASSGAQTGATGATSSGEIPVAPDNTR